MESAFSCSWSDDAGTRPNRLHENNFKQSEAVVRQSMTETDLSGKHVVVAGGGVVGLSVAYFTRQAGAHVTVLERRSVGSGASRGNGGLIVTTDSVPLPAPGMVREGLRHLFSDDSSFFVHPTSSWRLLPFLVRFGRNSTRLRFNESLKSIDLLNVHTRSLFAEMQQVGVGTGVSSKAMLRCYKDQEKAQADFARYTAFSQRGLAPAPDRLLQRDELLSLEPALGERTTSGFIQNGDFWTDPSAFVDELWAYLEQDGVEFHQNTSVTDIRERSDKVDVITDCGTYSGDHAVVTAGARTRRLAAKLGVRLILESGKGYSFAVTPQVLPKRALMFGDAHVEATPISGGRLRIAGTMEFGGADESASRGRIDAIRRTAAQYLRGIDWSAVTDEWVGARPMTPDGLPYIGFLPNAERTMIATGHNMLGFSLAPATGKLVAGMLTGRAERATYAPFAVNRFDRR